VLLALAAAAWWGLAGGGRRAAAGLPPGGGALYGKNQPLADVSLRSASARCRRVIAPDGRRAFARPFRPATTGMSSSRVGAARERALPLHRPAAAGHRRPPLDGATAIAAIEPSTVAIKASRATLLVRAAGGQTGGACSRSSGCRFCSKAHPPSAVVCGAAATVRPAAGGGDAARPCRCWCPAAGLTVRALRLKKNWCR